MAPLFDDEVLQMHSTGHPRLLVLVAPLPQLLLASLAALESSSGTQRLLNCFNRGAFILCSAKNFTLVGRAPGDTSRATRADP